jgi:NADH-quinone oxidoreductase subunit E
MEQEVLTPEDEEALRQIASKIESYEKRRRSLIPVLQMMQETAGYLPREAIKIAAQYLDIPECGVYGVATFYNQFRFHPPGKHNIKVCMGTACAVRGGAIILENFERKLNIHDGETTPDREFSLETVACVGCCALAPVAVFAETDRGRLDQEAVRGHMTPSAVEGLIEGIAIEREKKARVLKRMEMEKQIEERVSSFDESNGESKPGSAL